MKIIQSKLVPKRFCVNLFGTIWVSDPRWIDEKIINHERIHTAQQRELLFVPFYVLYGIEWLVRLVLCFSFMRAYRSMSFEREAYGNDADMGYLERRRAYAWLRYVFNRK